MPRGGARTRSGPQPEFDALKRERDSKTFTRLPKECTRPVPDWPLEVPDPTVAELAMWERMWALPQAHVWHADRSHDMVALYVRQFIEAARPKASSQLRINVRQQATELLLSTNSLNGARYVIVESPEDEILQRSAAAAATGTDGRAARPGPQRSARSRMQVVPTGPIEPGPDDEIESEDDPDA